MASKPRTVSWHDDPDTIHPVFPPNVWPFPIPAKPRPDSGTTDADAATGTPEALLDNLNDQADAKEERR